MKNNNRTPDKPKPKICTESMASAAPHPEETEHGGVGSKAWLSLSLKSQVSPLLHPPGRMQDSAGMEQGRDYRNIRWAGLPSCHWTPAPWGGKEKVCFSSKVHTTSSAVLQKNLQPAAQSLLMISQKQNNFIVSTQSTSDLKAMYVLSRLPHQE